MEFDQPKHTEATLLPGYITHTLTPEEHQRVKHHLESCPTCEQELQEVRTMQTALKTAIQQRPGPSPAAFSKIMTRIHQETGTVARESRIRDENRYSWWESLERIFRYPFEIQWMPALASFLIVGQTILLLLMLGGPERRVGLPQGPVIDRGIPKGVPASPSLKFQVKFVETAQESQIRQVIQKLGGQIVHGPTKEGFYTLSFIHKETESTETILSALNSHPQLIKTAKSL